MVTEHLIKLLNRDLDRLKEEMNLYQTEEKIWELREGIANSGGNLCLHLCGNLQHFIGATLDNTGYIRNRNAEFAAKNIPREKLLNEVEATRLVVTDILEGLTRDELNREYPLHVFGEPMTTEFFLIHLTTHLGYHLGQINYHRRMVG
jgi:uncharacterized damage-inducible protein DinB